jgi:hypothetical protein
VSVTYAERVPFPAEPVPRFWRGNLQVVAATWGGVLSGVIPAIAWDLPFALGVAIGLAVAGGVIALPPRPSRRADLSIEVADGELRLVQGTFRRRVLTKNIRRVSVHAPVGGERPIQGWGPVFGRGLRWTLEVPDPSLGVVRIDRSRDGFDIDVATARPDELVQALRAQLAR